MDKDWLQKLFIDQVKPILGSNTSAEPVAYDFSAFDSEGKIVATFADGSTKTTTMEFDADGNPIKITGFDGKVVVMTW